MVGPYQGAASMTHTTADIRMCHISGDYFQVSDVQTAASQRGIRTVGTIDWIQSKKHINVKGELRYF